MGLGELCNVRHGFCGIKLWKEKDACAGRL